MSDARVSIVVPAYNSEKYIARCIDSIIHQSYSNWNLILVDDGSTDRTAQIVERYLYDSRIRLYSQKNQGVGEARNTGLANVTGEYVLFVDSDDYIQNNMLEDLVNLYQEYDVDLVLEGYKKKDNNHFYVHSLSKYRGFYDMSAFFRIFCAVYDTNALHAIGCKLYKTKLLKKYRLRFENKDYFEDVGFCIRYIMCCKNVYINDKAHYVYDISIKDSLSKRKNFDQKVYLVMKHMNEIYHMLKERNSITNEFYRLYCDRVIWLIEEYSKSMNREKRILLKISRDFMKYPITKMMYHNKTILKDKNGWEKWIRICIIYNRRKLFQILMIIQDICYTKERIDGYSFCRPRIFN